MLQKENAVLFVFVEWSIYPLMTRPRFEKMVERITSDYSAQIDFYSVEEEAEFAATWLEKSNIEGLAGKHAMGWGAILWFHKKQLVHKLLYTHKVPEEDLYRKPSKCSVWRGTR